MATVLPFKALRANSKEASQIAALPYDVYSREEAKKEVQGKPLSFLRVDRAEITLPDSVDTYDDQVYQKAKKNLEELINNGSFIKEEKPVFYLYELKVGDHSQTGLVGTCLVDEVLDKTIKDHELTRKDKEEDRIKHVDTLNANTGPIFLTYRNKPEITQVIKELKKEKPLFSFESDDKVEHSVWKIEDQDSINFLSEKFKEIDNFYIADGHHRCASAVKVALKRRETEKEPGDHEYDHFLSVIFPDNELKILDYNRVIKDLNGLNKDEFIKKLKESFNLNPSEKAVKPEKKGSFGMFLDGNWYLLELKEELPEKALDRLDVSILNNKVLYPILGIKDLRTDKRIDFVGGIKGLEELEKRVYNDMAVAFSMYPTQLSELMEIANQNQIMPPKSTWFEPKLRSGLFIHEF